MSKIEYYCLNYNNEIRRKSMTERFNKLNLSVKMFNGVHHKDQSISILKGHLEMLTAFLASGSDYAIIMEDDVLITKDFNERLPNIIKDFEDLKLDILLLGYLINYTPSDNMKIRDCYYKYDDHLWGTQCYVISRQFCKWFLFDYPLDVNCGVGIDSLITKFGNRAMVFPPVIIEDGLTLYHCENQRRFHKSCYQFCNNETFI